MLRSNVSPVSTEVHEGTLIDAQRVHTLLSVVRLITLEKNPDELLLLITKQGAAAMHAERGAIFLLDEKRGEIWSKVALGEKGMIRFPRGAGIAGESIEKNAIIRIPDAYADDRFNRRIDIETGFRTRNILAIPMINADGKTIGCFQLINKIDAPFTTMDESFGEAFAAQAAVAIESALLHQQKDVAILHLEQARFELQSNINLLQILYEIEQDCHVFDELKGFLFAACKKAMHATNGLGAALLLETSSNVFDLYGTLDGKESLDIARRIDDSSMVERYFVAGLPSNTLTLSPLAKQNSLIQWLDETSLEPLNHVKSIAHTQTEINMGTSQSDLKVHRIALEVFGTRSDGFTTTDQRWLENIGAKIAAMVERRMLIEQQTQSSRLAMIGQLTSTIIHDFKNPLTVMQGFAEIIERGREQDLTKIQHYGSVIRAQVGRCRKMTEELLRFARGEKSFAFEQVQIADFFKEIEMVLAVEVARQAIALKLNINYDGALWMDREKMLRLIFNLTNNAIEVLKEGDQIVIDCDQLADGMIRIQVTDSGPGIPEAISKTLFDPFVTSGKKGGTGLGLHIAKDVAAGHLGSIGLDASHKGGARFVVMLHPDPRQLATSKE